METKKLRLENAGISEGYENGLSNEITTENAVRFRNSSAAFKEALLRSEQKRIVGVLAFVTVLTIAAAARNALNASHMSGSAFLLPVTFIIYESAIFFFVTRSLRASTQLPPSLWYFNVVIEMLFPAVGLAFFVSNGLEAAYRPIASPWFLVFFPFLILSTLRLSPRICFLGGAVAATGFLAAAYNLGWRPTISLQGHTVMQTAVPFYALVLLTCGGLAGAVSNEIREHVEAALREAETKRKLEQVEHDLQIARSIQQSLLPTVSPTIDGFQVAGWNRSADATGGDYFDWRQLEDGRLVVSLADVTGHGIGPALLASVCRAYARASFDTCDNLPLALQRINRSLGEDLTPGRFATFVAAICKAGSSQVELLSAGHGPLFTYSNASDTLREFNAQAIPLGLMPDLSASDPLILSMEEGDLLLLITDGFFEWENVSGEQFGSERLATALRRAKHLPPDEIISSLYQSVLEHAQGSPQQDDLTAVVVKCTRTNGGNEVESHNAAVLARE